MPSPVWMVGAGGRTPFVGGFRGARTFGRVELAWAGRIAGSAGVSEGWDAAEAARDALAGMDATSGIDDALLGAARALGAVDARWLGRGDLTVLLMARDDTRAAALASGLASIWGPDGAGWQPLVPPDHPLLGEPGVPSGPPTPLPLVTTWVALPHGLRFPVGDVRAACGVRA